MNRATRAVLAALVPALLVTSSCSRSIPSAPDGVATPSPRPSAPAGPSAPVPTAVVPPTRAEPTNFLVIEADDLRTDELRWMPRTRRLIGGQGLEFHNSFAPNPLCCPSRASFLTGQYSHNHEVLSHQEPYGFRSFDDSETLATALQTAGYRTALVGKYLNGYGEQPTYDGQDSLTYVPPGWTEWYAGSDHLWAPGESPGGGTYDYFHLTSNVNGEIRSWPGEYTTNVTGGQVRDLVDQFDARRKAAPWFVWWTPVAPHHGLPIESDDPGRVPRSDGRIVDWVTPARPAEVQGRFDGRIRSGLGVPPASPEERDVSDKPLFLRRLPALSDTERDVLTEVSRQRAEAISVLDQEIARTLRALRRSGQVDNTVVVFTSDNGYYLGEHRKRQGKINLHEPSIRVPLLMSGPGVPHGERFDPISTLDLAVTIASSAGADLKRVDGADLRKVIADGDQGWDRAVVLEGLMPDGRYSRATKFRNLMSGLNTVGLRLGRWKYVRYSTGETELYDLAKDPLELQSLSGPEFEGLRARVDRLWRRYVDCTGPTCRVLVPRRFRLSAEESRRITQRLAESAAAYYGQ